jgi:hypothetical protein
LPGASTGLGDAPDPVQTPLSSVTGGLLEGSDVAQPDTSESADQGPDRTLVGVATIVGLLVVLVAITSGLGGAIGMLGLAAVVIGAIAVVRDGATWARIVGRRAAAAVALAGFVVMGIGGALSPQTATDNTAAGAAAPTSSAAPTTAAPKATSAAPQPLVAAPATTTSKAPVLPPAPVMALTCPNGGTVASPVYGQQISATAPYSVTISYGDGDQYTNDDQHLAAIFSHTYQAAGTFAVNAVLTDSAGQTASASCTYTWTKPVQAATGGSSSGTVAGGSGTSGTGSSGAGAGVVEAPAAGSASYANCDAVRAAGAAPIHPGDPGFQPKFDRDNDGVGCE